MSCPRFCIVIRLASSGTLFHKKCVKCYSLWRQNARVENLQHDERDNIVAPHVSAGGISERGWNVELIDNICTGRNENIRSSWAENSRDKILNTRK